MINEKKRYYAIDGLRAYSMLGIVAFHVLANGQYSLNGFVFDTFIPSFSDLVFLFMIVSGFGMCCGYYERVVSGTISIEKFYKNRYAKIWPFFAFLCILDLVVSPGKESAFQVFANLTLLQGFIPNADIQVISVSWTLAVIFVFYVSFPFICFLLCKKTRAWLAFTTSLILNLIFSVYSFGSPQTIGKSSFIFCLVFFLTGGLIYLYRDSLQRFSEQHRLIALTLCIGAVLYVFFVRRDVFGNMLIGSTFLIYSLGVNRKLLLWNPASTFLGSISFEIYLCHMVIFRCMERLHLLHLFSNDIISYVFDFIFVSAGAIVFAVVVRWIFGKIKNVLSKVKK